MRMSSPIVSVQANWHTTFDSATQSFEHKQKKPLFTQLKFTTTSLNLFVTKIQRKICTIYEDFPHKFYPIDHLTQGSWI